MGGLVHRDGEPKVHQFGRVSIREKNVARLDIAMDEVVFEGRLEPLGDLDPNFQHLRLWQAALDAHEIVERAFLGEFHRQVKLTVVFAKREDLDHVRMIDRGGDAGFFFQPGAFFGVGAAFLLQDFQGDFPVESAIHGLVNGPIPPSPRSSRRR